MKIAVGSDHVGFSLKSAIIEYLKNQNIEVIDHGAFNSTDVVDYPDSARKVAESVSSGVCERGVVICGTGVGISIAVNKHPGIRAVLCDNYYIAQQSRVHNDTNVIAMGALVTTPQLARQYLDVWLSTDFEGGRHIPRLARLDLAFNENWNDLTRLDRSQLKIGIALSPNKTVFGPLMFAGDLEDGLNAAAKTGFDCVELSLRVPGELEINHLKEMIKNLNLTVSAIATGQSYLQDGLSLASSSAEKRNAVVERIKGHIRFAVELNAVVIIGGIRGKFIGTEEEQKNQVEPAEDALIACLEEAEKFGVNLVLEPINRYETNWINTIQQGLMLIEKIGKPNLKLLPDTFHMNIEEPDISQSIKKAGNQIGYMHFGDSNRRAPGMGHTNFAAVIQALCQAGYNGVITSEIYPLPTDLEAMQQTSGYLKGLLKS